jgi:hypothetical protein
VRIFQHPIGHNIDWRAVVSLLQAVANVERTHNKLLVTLGDETQIFEPPRHKDIDAQQVVDLRRMLKGAGHGIGALSDQLMEPGGHRGSTVVGGHVLGVREGIRP